MSNPTQIGEKGPGTGFFLFRYSDRLRFDRRLSGIGRNQVYAVRNLQDHAEPWRGVPLPARQLLLVTDADHAVGARTRLDQAGQYFLAAEFSTGYQAGAADALLCVNGEIVWSGSDGGRCTHLVDVPAGSVVDFCVQGRAAGAGACWVGIRCAIFSCDPVTGLPGGRIDDEYSGLETETAREWLRQDPPQARSVALRPTDRAGRISALEKSWSMDAHYFGSQFGLDLPAFVDGMLRPSRPPDRKYVIFFTPRSGSTMLTEVLARTGSLGYPGEYFVPEWIRGLSLAFSDLEDSYEQLVLRRLQSPNGVFGIEIEGDRVAGERGFFGSLTDWRVIYLVRKDLLAQALSYHIAMSSGVWHQFSAGTDQDEVPFSREKIIAHLNEMLRQEQIFEAMFREEGVAPHRIDYERMAAALPQEAARVADFIGVSGLNFAAADPEKTILKPTRGNLNQLYRLLTIAEGGECFGYDLHIIDGKHVAMLHGIDPALPPPKIEERAPAILMETDLDALRHRLYRTVESALLACVRSCLAPEAR